MPATVVLFVVVCGIGTLNSAFLAAYLWFHRKGDAVLNRLLAVLLLTFTARVSKAVVVFFISAVHPVFEWAWMAVLGMTGLIALLYTSRLARAAHPVRLVLRALAMAVVFGGLALVLLPLGFGWKVMVVMLAIYGSSIALALPFARARAAADVAREALVGRWLRGLLAFLVAIWVLHATLVVGRLRGPVIEERFFDIEALVFSLAIYALIFAELRFGLVARLHQAGAEPVAADDPMLKRLRRAMEVERLYLDPSLSLPSLARVLKLSPQHVSRLINAGIGVSFNDYVNRLRIEEVTRILALPEGASRKIGQLGFDCGFNSASVFYAAFRKFTGKTPSEYIKDLTRT